MEVILKQQLILTHGLVVGTVPALTRSGSFAQESNELSGWVGPGLYLAISDYTEQYFMQYEEGRRNEWTDVD